MSENRVHSTVAKNKNLLLPSTFTAQMRECGYTASDKDVSWADLRLAEADIALKTCYLSSSTRQVAKNLIALRGAGKEITSIKVLDEEPNNESDSDRQLEGQSL